MNLNGEKHEKINVFGLVKYPGTPYRVLHYDGNEYHHFHWINLN